MPPKRKTVSGEDAAAKKARTDGIVWSEEFENNAKIPQVFYRYDPKAAGKEKVICFDIDWTIIATASGKKFPTSTTDWKWWSETVPKKLKELQEQGYRIIFFSNQGGIEKGKQTIAEMESKVDAITDKAGLGGEIFAFLSTGESHYRKPSSEMWDLFVKKCNDGVKVDLGKSKYVGDAAGRPKDWSQGKSKDFSCTDRMFAANIGIEFQTPEEFFLGWKVAKFNWGSVDPKTIPKADQDKTNYAKEVVVLVGMPASGKSSFFHRHFAKAGYVHVNRDTLNTPAKCLKEVVVLVGMPASGKSSFFHRHFAKAGYVHVNRDTLNTPAKCLKEVVVLVGMPASGKSSFFHRHFAKAGYVHVNRGTLNTPAKYLKEVVVLVGMPASGKSSFFQRHFAKAGYVHVNRDTLNTPAKCLKVASESLGSGKSVVVDNTNPSKSARADFIKLAKDKKVPIRCIHIKTEKEIARHLNYVRQNRTRGAVRRIPDVGYHVFNKHLELPTKEEGFAEVLSVQFAAAFDDKEHERIFHHWTA